MVKKIKTPAGLVVQQSRMVPREFFEEAGVAEPETDEGTQLQETLTYLFPGKLRSDIEDGSNASFYAVSDHKFVKVSQGDLVATSISLGERYIDVLLNRDYKAMEEKLQAVGVNTQKVTFQRLDGGICYFIGQPPVDGKLSPGLWIEKDSLFPVRYLVQHKQWMVDVRYENWQQVSKTWYPMSVQIFVDNRLFSRIRVDTCELGAGFSLELFDVDGILQRHPVQNLPEEGGGGHNDRVRDLNKELEEFNKLYD